MIKTAAILAAGAGIRLEEKTKIRPKGFMVIGDKTLVGRSIENLLEVGIEKIIIGVGYMCEWFQELKSIYPQLQFVKNNDYSTTSSMTTFFHMRDVITDDFLLLESDLLYEKMALKEILSCPAQNVILSSHITDYGDEVFLEVNDRQQLTGVSKKRDDLENIHSVLVGISKVSREYFIKVCDYYQHELNHAPLVDYEHVFARFNSRDRFYVHKVNNLAWCEIDNIDHFQKAQKEIFPLIEKRDGYGS